MASVSKRRTSSRNKTQKTATFELKKASIGKILWLREFSSLAMIAFALFVGLSLVSYFYSGSGTQGFGNNVMGRLGDTIARNFVKAFGYCSFLPVAWLLWVAFIRRNDTSKENKRYGTLGLASGGIFGLLGLCVCLFLIGGTQFGGGVGEGLAQKLMSPLGYGGTILASSLLVLVSGLVLTHREIEESSNFLKRCIVRFGTFWVVTVPKYFLRASWGVTCVSGNVLRSAATGLSRALLETPEYKAPKKSVPVIVPKARKNVVAKVEEPVEDDDVRPVIPKSDPVIVKARIAELKNRRQKPAAAPVMPDTQGELSPYANYLQPELELLQREEVHQEAEDDDELKEKAQQIEAKLRDFNIAGSVTQVHPGPVITLFEFEPAPGVKVGRIAALQDDLSMSLRASSIRIIAPIPKRGTVGIEVPNRHRHIVRLRDCLESEAYQSAESILSVPLGKDTYGESVVVDVAQMPHLLMAGATGTGKSVCINAILLSLLYKAHPAELGLILIDPKVLELSIYEGIPHLRVPVVTDPNQAKAVLSWAVKEMDRRYRYMQRFGVRNIDGYNKVVRGEDVEDLAGAQIPLPLEEPEQQIETGSQETPAESTVKEVLKPLPKLVIVIDELADLMLSVGREIEELITRLAQKARAAGIHLIVATQRPSVDVITGLIKANFPARLSFRVSSRIDSRTILDSMGSEKLLGKGDMLFMLPGAVPLKRIHGAFVSDSEVAKVVNSIKSQGAPQYDSQIIAAVEKAKNEGSAEGSGGDGENGENVEYDPFYDKAVELVVEKGQASTSMIQRAFRIGYNRAARIIEVMEKEGIVGPMDGVKPREILAPQIGQDA